MGIQLFAKRVGVNKNVIDTHRIESGYLIMSGHIETKIVLK